MPFVLIFLKSDELIGDIGGKFWQKRIHFLSYLKFHLQFFLQKEKS